MAFANKSGDKFAHYRDIKRTNPSQARQMKQADKFGRSHTAWVTEKAETEEAPRETPKKKKGAK